MASFAFDSLRRRRSQFVARLVLGCTGLSTVVWTLVRWAGGPDLHRAQAVVQLMLGAAFCIASAWGLVAAYREWREPWSARRVLSKQRRRGLGRSVYLVRLSPAALGHVRLSRREWDSVQDGDYLSKEPRSYDIRVNATRE